MAKDTLERFVERATRLYEREQYGSNGTPLFGSYVRRWEVWVKKNKPRPLAELSNLIREYGRFTLPFAC